MTENREDRPWLDELNRKHECGPCLSDHRLIDVTLRSEAVRVSIPDNLDEPERLEIRAVLGDDRHLVLIGRHAMTIEDSEDYERGILMVARRRDDGVYVVHVWHELYPWALKYLGLESASDGEEAAP